MLDVKNIIAELYDGDEELDENTDLVELGILDSFGIIQLLSKLEDVGYEFQISRIDRHKLRTIKGIKELIEEYDLAQQNSLSGSK